MALGTIDHDESAEVQKPLVFHVGEQGLETSVQEVLGDAEFKARAPEDFQPNMDWSAVSVKTEADKDEWVRLENERLQLSWESNQDEGQKARNNQRITEIEQRQGQLEL